MSFLAVAVSTLLATLGLAPVALAQPAVVTLSARLDRSQAAPGDAVVAAVVFDHRDGWHVHTNAPQVPQSWSDVGFVPIPTTVDIDPQPWLSIGPKQWPETKTISADLAGTGTPDDYDVFHGRAIVFIPLRIAPNAPIGPQSLQLRVGYQACNDTICDRPRTQTLTLPIEVVASPAPATTPDAATFGTFDPAVLARTEVWSTPAATPANPGATPSNPAEGEAAAPVARTFFGIPLPGGGGMVVILTLFFLGALGGLILNLTPCVLPVIPIKVMTISQQAGSPGRTLYLGLWMAAGVVAFWLALSIPAILIGDPSRVFGIWWVTFGLGVLIGAMALGLMGLFQLTLPQALYAVNPKADTAWGSFVFGIMTAILGLPCFGFVAGALLAAAATLPKIATFAIFAGLGVGMALPYLVLSARPGLVHKIPRTGPASDLLKQVMGLLLLGAAVFFAGTGLIALVIEKPWMGRQLHWWVIVLCCVAAAVWMVARTFQITPRPGPRGIFTVIGLVVAVLPTLFALSLTGNAKASYLAQAEARAAADEGRVLTGVWMDWTPRLLERARESGKIVVVDFTADWCFNCKGLKATVLGLDPVKSELAKGDVVLLTVDLTSTVAPGWEYLESLGQTGIPLLVIYTPGRDQPWMSNAYTPALVMEALAKARSAGAPD